MADQIKTEGQSPEETPWVTFGLLAMRALAIGGVELRALADKFTAYVQKTEPAWLALSQIDWVAAIQRLDALPQKSKDAMQIALAEGWFFGWHDSLQGVMELVESLGATPGTTVDDIMVAYYRANLQPFSDQLISQYPDRAAPIKAAVDAHMSLSDGDYFLSTPVFIAQADGLFTQNTGIESPITPYGLKKFRAKHAGNPETLDLLYQFLELKSSAFMMTAQSREDAALASGKAFTALNRHQVMHGERSDYGTEINSLKAFSFLVSAGLHIPSVLK